MARARPHFRGFLHKAPLHDHRDRKTLVCRAPLQAAWQRRVRRAQDPGGHAHHRVRRRAHQRGRGRPAPSTNPDDPFHTFFFALSSGKVIDGGDQGNDARWINHSCTPNCEAQEGRHGKRVYIVALRDIARGEELAYDYGLVLDGKITKTLKEGYRCLCGTENCRGTMLALPKKKKAGKKTAKAA